MISIPRAGRGLLAGLAVAGAIVALAVLARDVGGLHWLLVFLIVPPLCLPLPLGLGTLACRVAGVTHPFGSALLGLLLALAAGHGAALLTRFLGVSVSGTGLALVLIPLAFAAAAAFLGSPARE
ncbi:hypothetical protein HII36_31235 [Nonomuraea sp. NN258]|uniref:hypothetical protein n=1 Tax=Nonomuraea antri TaxID=2730852 RepID=UPI00156996F5|nr:hypothetical protein [Nonomuraea antri]NRQ36275.1 hypothetical protein [Nonomuraea antri]